MRSGRTLHAKLHIKPFIYQRRRLSSGIHDIWSKTISSKRRLVECDIWSIRRFADYDVWSTTTIGRKFVKLRRNLVEIWSKTDLYRKIKIVYFYDSHISNIFPRQYQYKYFCLSCTESPFRPLFGPCYFE